MVRMLGKIRAVILNRKIRGIRHLLRIGMHKIIKKGEMSYVVS